MFKYLLKIDISNCSRMIKITGGLTDYWAALLMFPTVSIHYPTSLRLSVPTDMITKVYSDSVFV
jgi:hypothetical protein